jgi:hypothetical protein
MTEVTKTEKNEIAVFDYSSVEETGFENQTQEDRSTPYLGVLQQNSPQCRDPEDGGIEGAKAGMFYNSATNELYEGRNDGVVVVPAYTEHVFVEYRPRESGGGFVGSHSASSDLVKEARSRAVAFNRLSVNGNDLTEQFNVYAVLTEGEDVLGGIVIPFTSTKIKAYKKWNTRVSTLLMPRGDGKRAVPPLFSHLVRIRSVSEENQHGKFFGVSLAPAVDGEIKSSLIGPTDDRFIFAQALMQSVSSGHLKASAPVSEGGSEAVVGDAPF